MAEIYEAEIVSDHSAQLVSTETALAVMTPVGSGSSGIAPDVMALLLADKRNPNTQRSYQKAWKDFFTGSPALAPLYADSPSAAATAFCKWPRTAVMVEITTYKARLLEAQKTEATVNQRLAAIKSLLAFAYKFGIAEFDPRGLVDGERVQGYRDTRGIDVAQMGRLLKRPALKFPGSKHAVRRLRDAAILRVLCENGIRNDSLCRADVRDFRLSENALWIYSKGHGTQQRRISLSRASCDAIESYLRAAGHTRDSSGPLFRSLDHRPDKNDGRLSNDGLRWLVGFYGAQIGVPQLRPHKLRHSAITALLDATGGDVRAVQKFSGHAKIDTLLIYDDNRADKQGELTGVLSGLLDGKPKKRK